VLRGGRDVTARLAYGVARLTNVSINDLLAGILLSPRTYPYCGGHRMTSLPRRPSSRTNRARLVK
jgi:hypothetical protein